MPGEGPQVIEVPHDISVIIYRREAETVLRASTSLVSITEARKDLEESGEAEEILCEIALAKDGTMHPAFPALCLLTPFDDSKETIWDVIAAKLLEAFEMGVKTGRKAERMRPSPGISG